MAISIDPLTFIISVPQADLDLVSGTIYEMDTDAFRLELKAWEANGNGLDGGQTFLKTHVHNTEVTVAGTTFARALEILPPYSVEFEDGQYTVILQGSNNNIFDVAGGILVQNQVQIISTNSAGLTSSPEIQYASYAGGVTIDMVAGESGTYYPIGTPRRPVDNFIDALDIASSRGLTKMFVIGDATIASGINVSNFTIIGQGQTKSTITIDTGAFVQGILLSETTVTGVLDGSTNLENCLLQTLSGVGGEISNCGLDDATITLSGETHFINCYSNVAGSTTPIIDAGGAGRDFSMRNYNGGIQINNKTGSDKVSIDLNSGKIVLDSTVTAGEIVIRGVGLLTDNSTAAVNSEGLVSVGAIWETVIDNNITAEESHRIILGVLAGKTTIIDLGSGLATVTFRDLGDTKDRLIAEMSGSVRTNITLDAT